MTREPPNDTNEMARLQARLDALERERAEQVAAAHTALAAAQDKSYWLDRWNLDLNALMRRPGASEFRALLRAFRAVVRHVQRLRGKASCLPKETRLKLTQVRHTIEDERSRTPGEARKR